MQLALHDNFSLSEAADFYLMDPVSGEYMREDFFDDLNDVDFQSVLDMQPGMSGLFGGRAARIQRRQNRRDRRSRRQEARTVRREAVASGQQPGVIGQIAGVVKDVVGGGAAPQTRAGFDVGPIFRGAARGAVGAMPQDRPQRPPVDWGRVAIYGAVGIGGIILISQLMKKKK